MSLVVRISGDLSGFNKAMNNLDRELKNASADIGRIGKEFERVGGVLTKSLTIPLIGIGAASIGAAASFEKAMSVLKATSGATAEEMKELEATARHWGRNSVFNANQVAEAMELMALASMDVVQIQGALPAVLALAQSAKMDLGNAVSIVAGAVNAFNLEATDASRVADVLAVANKNANTSVSELGSALENVQGTAGSFGFTIEDTVLMLSLMSEGSITGSKAGTMLRNAIEELADACTNGNQAMRKLGISFFDTTGSARPLSSVMRDLRSALSGMDDAQQRMTLSQIFGAQGMQAMLPILSATDDEFESLASSLEDTAGMAQYYADIMSDNLKTEMKIFWNNIRDIGIELGNVFLPILREVMGTVIEFARSFAENLTPEIASTIVKIGLIIAAIGPLLIIIGKLIGIFAKVKGAIKVLTGAKGALVIASTAVFAKIIAVIAVIAGLVVMFNYVRENNDRFRDAVVKAWEMIKKIGLSIWQMIKETVQDVVREIKEFWEEHGEMIMEAAANVFHFILGVVEFIMPVIQGIVKFAWNFLVNKTTAFLDIMMGIIQVFAALFTGDWDALWEGIQRILKGAFNKVTAIFRALWSVVGGIFENALDWLDGIARNLAVVVVDHIRGMRDRIVSTVTNIKSRIKSIWEGIMDFFRGIDLNEIGRNIVQGLLDGITDMFGSVSERVSELTNLIPSSVRNLLGINSPSRVLMEIGEFAGEGLEVGLKNSIDDIYRASELLSKAMMPEVNFNTQGSIQMMDRAAPVTTSTTNNYANMFEGANFNVRSDQDVRSLAEEFAFLIDRERRRL